MKTFEEALTNLLLMFRADQCARYIKALGFPKQYQLDAYVVSDGDAMRHYIVEEFRRIHKEYKNRLDTGIITISTRRFIYKIYYSVEEGYDLWVGFVPIEADTFE